MGWSISKVQPEHLIVIHQRISTWHFGFNLSNPSLNWTWANHVSKITTDTEMDHLWYRNSCKKMQGIKLNESLPEKRWKIFPFSCGLLHWSISNVFFLDFVGGKNPKGSMLWCILPTFIYPPKLPIYILVNICTINWACGKIQYLSGSNILGNKTSTLKCKNMYPRGRLTANAPENIPYQKERIIFATIIFQGRAVKLWGGYFSKKSLKKKAKFQSLIAVHEVGTNFPEDADGGKEGT